MCNYGGNKTHRSEFAHKDINRHVNAHLVLLKGACGSFSETQHTVQIKAV